MIPGEHLDPTEELALDTIKARAVKGIVALTGRTFFLQTVGLFATFLLTVFLSPTQYGVFFVVSAVINFFGYFSDVGLAAALIQKKESLTEKDLKTTFTIQQILVISFVIIIFAATPLIQTFYKLNDLSVYLLWALTLAWFLSSLKTIPSILLERHLEFQKLIIPQILETIVFYGIAVVLAWRGLGITSFTIAVVVRGVTGLIAMYVLQPWKPGFAFARAELKHLLRFGIPYQTNTFLAMLKDDGMTMVLGGILGPTGVGFLGWAQKWAMAPLRFFMDQVIKVTFPAFSRMQDDKEELSRAVSRSLFFICALVFPAIMGLILLAPSLVAIIPKYGKWQPALLALTLISVNAFWAAITTPLTNTLNAIGKITITFRLMIMWVVLSWIFIPFLAIRYSINGAALGYAIVGTSSIVAIWWAMRFVKIDIRDSIIVPLIAAISMGIVVFIAGNLLPLSIFSVAFLIALGIASYSAVLYLFVGPPLFVDAQRIYAAIRKK